MCSCNIDRETLNKFDFLAPYQYTKNIKNRKQNSV